MHPMPNPAFEGTAHLRRFAGRWVPSALRASTAPQLRR
jgi:hypothetical protein